LALGAKVVLGDKLCSVLPGMPLATGEAELITEPPVEPWQFEQPGVDP
jgi:hypothetical protein